jgi:hypothetical protein
MPNRIEARSAKAALTNATGRLPLLRLFSTPLISGSCRSRCLVGNLTLGLVQDRPLHGKVTLGSPARADRSASALT